MQLIVLGSAFDHPSIDAECAAAIALLRLENVNFTLVAGNSGPTLLVDGRRYIGYSNIYHHLKMPSADETALMALLETRAPVLLQAYLYTGENYSATRSAFSPILPIYARFLVPPALRSAAMESTSHLGISSADVDEVESEPTHSLLLPKVKTVRGLLAQEQPAFKLRALADALLEPLSHLLTDDNCLAYGYLGLMLKPAVPQPWLSKIIKEHYPRLEAFVQRMDANLDAQQLPWTDSNQSRAEIVEDIGTHLRSNIVGPSVIDTGSSLPTTLLACGAALVAGASWLLLPLLAAPHGDAEQLFGSRPLDHVSNVLAGLSFAQPHVQISTENELPAQANIEVDL